MKINKNIKKFNKYLRHFDKHGYVLIKNFFTKKDCESAAKWLRRKNQKKLAKTWTEQEPGVPLAVYFVVHKGNSPISKLARNKSVLDFASKLVKDEVYIYSSKVNLKAAWCGAVEYYHQDLVYWRDRGYPREDMISYMIMLDPHKTHNAPLHVFPGTHKMGFIKHEPFININGLAKFMVPTKKLDQLKQKYGLKAINAKPGDVLFFHMGLVHGSSHNISGDNRMVVLSQINTKSNIPRDVNKNSKKYNLSRAKMELEESKRKYNWFKKKYTTQLRSKKLTFSAPIVSEEKN